METANLAGNIGSLGILPNGNGTNKQGKSVGASITYVQQSGQAVAGIGKATVTATGDVDIYSETDERHILVTPSSGMGKGLGFNGVLGFLNSEVLTHASLHKGAQLSAGDLVIVADHEFGNWAAAGAVNWSTESAVGIAIAANVSQGDTKAFIGDNSSEYDKVKFQDSSNSNTTKPDPTSPTAPTPTKGIVANSVSVRGRSSGTNGSIAVAGALTTEPTNEPGVGQKFENWYNGLSSKVAANYTGANSSNGDSSVGQASSDGANDNSNSNGNGQSSAEVSSAQTGLAGAGSFTVSVNNMDAKAIIDGASISGHSNGNGYNDVDVEVQALEKVISASASGSAALSMLGTQSPSTQNTIAGAIAYQISFNVALAWIKDTTISYADDVAVQALHGGELTSVALALSVTGPAGNSQMTQNGALSISGAQIYDGTSARIEGSSISSNNGVNNDLEVSAYNNSYVGVGGGTLYAGGKQGAGLAITFAEINDPSAIVGDANPDGNNVLSSAYDEDVYDGKATEAIIDFSGSTRSTISNFDQIDVSARSLNRIGIGAAGIGYNDNLEDSLGFQGSFAIGSIGADTKALVKGSDISGATTVNVNATGEKDGDLDTIISNLGSSDTNKDFDFSGAEAMDNTNVHTAEDGSGSTYSYNSEGKRIIAVAGVVQVGKKNLGISYAHADVKSETKARIVDTNINKDDNTGATVNVNARDNSLLYSVAIGVGVGTGGFSGVGSVAVNRLNNQILAEIGDWDGSDKGTINASNVAVTAQNDMDMINVAGSVAVASGQGGASAGGLAVALNLVGTDEHSTRARVSNTTLKVDEDLTVKALSGASNDKNLLVGNAIAIGASLGQSGIGFAGAISTNNVDQTIQAAIKDTATNRSGDASSNSGGDVIVKGHDYTDSVATAWMGAGSGNGSAGGVAIATNRVDSDVTAEVLGNGSTAGSTTLKAQNVVVDAFRRNWLLTIDAGVAASKQVSLAGSVGTGVIDGDVTARIAEDARVEVWNNVLVNADALSVNLVGSGAVGIGLDSGAGAVAISTAMEYGKTEAYIDDAVVIAKGKGSTMQVDTGDLQGYGDLPDLSTAGDDSDPDSVSMGDLTSGFDLLSVNRTKESVNGLVVNATSRTKQRAITVGGAGGKTVAINANVATNGTYNATKAYIKDSTINSGVTNESGADVYVRANAHEAGLAVSAGIAVSGGGEAAGAGVGGFATNAQKRSSEATVVNSTVNADKLTIDANSSKLAQAVSAGVAAGLGTTGGLGGAASVVITEQMGDTRAWLRGGTTNANEVVVVADRRQESNVAAGAAGIGTTVGVGIGLAVNIVGGDSQAIIGNDLDDNGDTYTTTVNSDTVTVDADRVSSVNSYTFGAGIGGSYGVAAMINTTEFRGETRAAVHGYLKSSDLTTDLRGSDGSSAATNVTVNAQEIQYANQMAAGIGAGASVGVGAVANVVLGRSQVYSEVVGSDVKAGTLDVDAAAQRESDLISVAGAASTNVAAAVSIGVALYGQGDTTAEDGTNAEDEFDPSRNEANTVLATDTASYNRHLSDDDIATLEADSGLTITRGSTPSTSTTTESGKSLKLSGESVTAARISGGLVDVDTLNVNSRTLQHSYQGLGAAQASSVGIAGVVGISRSYEMNIATVDSSVKANNAVIGASLENVSDDDGALEMKSFIVGLGGTSVVINYTDARSENRVVAGINSAVGDDTGDLQVTAKDSTEIRLGDVSSGKPSSVTDGSLNINVGAAAIGVSVGYAEKDGDIDAWIGEQGKLIDGYSNITLSAVNEGMVKSTGFALAGGLLAGVQGVITSAHDDSDVNATVYGTIGTGSGVVNVNAQSAPSLYSSAYGVTVAAGGAMGGSFAYATTETKAQAEIADGAIFNGSGNVVVRSETGSGNDGYETAYAAAFAASGGLLAGIAGSEARATNHSQSIAKVGDGVSIPYSDFSVYARHTGVQIADADGYFVGLVAGGYQTGVAQSFTSTRVEFGKDPIAALERTGDLTFDANSFNQNQSFTTAGGGGYYAGSAAESVMDAGDYGSGKYSAAVLVDDWSSGYRVLPVDAGGVYISAASETEFFAGTDSTTVSVVGGSGATSKTEVDTNVRVDLGKNVSFSAMQVDIDAFNSAYQIQNPYFSGFSSSVYGAGGGAANGSAGLSYQNLKNLTAEVILGKNGVLKISDLAWLDSTYDHNITIDANTDFYVYDESKLEIGGALQGAGAESDVDVKTRNKITVGEGYNIYNPVGEIGIGTYSRGSAVAQANVSVWAAAGVAGGVSDVYLDVLNQVNIGKNAVINSYGDVGIYSGRASNYFQENQLTSNALANVYNWTAIPIPAGNKAKSNISLTNKVEFADGFAVGSDSHVFIEANEGALSSTHRGIEKNPYLELFSSETTFGSSDSSTSNVLTFNGSGSVVAGQYAYQWVEVDTNGSITSQLYRYGTAGQMDDKYSSRAELEAYIQELEDRIAELEAWTPDSGAEGIDVADGADDDAVGDPGADDPAAPTGGGDDLVVDNSNPYQTEIDELKAEVVLLSAIVDDLSENPNFAIEVANVQATAGNVNLVADTITLAGSSKPTFTAKGDAYIRVENKTDEHLVLSNLSITNQTGGNVFVTGGASLSDTYIDEQSGSDYTDTTGITIDHAPSGANYLDSDVIINGDISNLLSSVNISVAEGDLIQQAVIEANAINLDVKNGSLLLNSNKPQTYGRDPDALVNYTSAAGWKPASADDFVNFYINDKYSTAINATGINNFNNWFSGRAIRHTGDQISYYQNSSSCKSCDYGYDEMNIYFNWGFSDAAEYHGSDAIVFEMKTNSDSRGGSKWKFKPISNKQSSLTQSASYSDVKSTLGGTGTSIIGEKVVINAQRLDINGKIIVGTDNSWSVDVGNGFDATIATYIKDAGLSSGDTVSIVPGQTKWLRVENPSYQPDFLKPDYDADRYIWKEYNFDVSANAGSSGIGLTYDVATGNITADDIPVSGGGYVAIRARISSTGEDGNITVKDGLGQIDINNDSNSQLVLGTISAGDDATGIIRITDLNKKKNIPGDGRGYKVEYSEWFVHSPGSQIRQYETSAWAVSYDESNYVASHGGTGTTSSMTYNPVAGQLYYIREGATIARSFDPPGDSSAPYDGKSIDGYFAKYPNTLGDWEYETNWNTETSYYTTCTYKPEACSGGTASNYLTQTYDYGSASVWRVNWGLSYDKYYGSNMTNVDPLVEVVYRLSMDTHTYVKADNAIKFQFTGSSTGSIDLTSKGNIELTGNVYNPSGNTNISTQNNLITAGSTAITSDVTTISAKGTIGSLENPLSVITDELGMSSSHGSLYFNVTGTNGDVELQHLKAKYDIVGVIDKGIVAKNSSTIIQADQLDLTSSTGGIGKVGTIGNTSSYQFINISTTGAVKLNAATDIAVNQASGDLELYSASASEEVVIKLGNGRLKNAIGRLDKTDEELAYDAAVWDSLHLLDDDAGAVTVSSYENQFTHKYHTYWMLKQRLTDTSDQGFTIDPAYLEALKLRYNETDEAVLTSLVKSDYQGLEQWFADQVATPQNFVNPEDAKGVEQKGILYGYDYADLFSGDYDQDYKLSLAQDSSWYTDMVDGAQWKQSQLDISISSTALNGDASSQLSNRDANVTASDVHFIVNSGGVGENLDDLVFTVNTTGSGTVSDAQKAALLAAGAGDISTEVSDSSVTFRVKQVDPIKVDVPGELYVSASDEIYIESTSGLTVGQLISSGDDVRLIVDGAIGSKSGLTNILGRDLYISNTRGDIGASGNALKLDLSGALRQAGAASDMYLHHVNGVLKLGSVSAGGLLSIYNNNDLLAYNDESFISADTFDLDVDSHDIGASSDALDVIMTGTGGLQMDAGNAWLNVRDTSLFTLDNTEVDNQFTLTSAGALDLQGNIKAKGLKLDVSGDITSGDGLAINVTNHTDLDAAGINLEGVTVQTGTASLYAQSGSLTLSDITTTSGLMSLLANGQMNLNGGVLTQTGNLVMDANRLVMDSLATINSAGDITATASDSMALFNLTANSGKVKLTTANNQNASLGAIVLTGLAARETEITSQTSITAGQMYIENTAVLNSGTFTTVNAVATSGDNFSITAGDNISINGPLTSEQGSIILRGQKDLFVNRRLDASREVDVDVVGTLTLDAAQTIASGQKTTLKAASLQMNQGSQLDIEGDLILATSGDQVLAQLDIEGSLDADSSTGSIRFNERADMAMAADIFAAGNVTIAEQQTLSTGSSLKVQSTALEMLAGSTLDAGTALNLINNTMSMGDGSLLKAAQSIQAKTSGSATFHQIESLQAVDLSAGDALTVNSTIDAGTALSIDADGTLTLHKAVAAKDNIAIDAVGVATMNGLVTSAEGAFLFRGDSHLTINNTVSTKNSFTVTDANAVSVATGKDIISESTVAINAASIQMGAGSKLDALSALTLTTTGNQNLATLDAGGDLKVESSTGWVAFDETVTTQGAADIDASGSLTLADNQNFNSSLGTDINASSVNFGDNSILNVDGSLNLSTVGQAELYTVDVEGSAALTHGGNLIINDRLDVVDSLTLDVGGDATFHGAVLVENALLADDIDGKLTVNDTLTVENDINITAGKDAEFNGVLTSNTGLLDIQGGAGLDFSDSVDVKKGSINLVITDGVSLSGGKTIASGGNTAIQSASVIMGDTARFDTGSDLIINTVGDQELATLDVDGNLDIDSASGHVELKEHVTVMNAVTIDALNGAVTLAENQQLYSGSDSTINAESLTFANGSVLEVDGALDVSTTADAELFKVDVANGAVFTNGGSLTTNSDVLIGDNLTLDVAGDAIFNKAVNVGNTLLADDIDGKLTVNDTVTVENDINITVGKDAEFNGVLTSKAGLLDIQGGGALTFNDDVSVNDSINLVITDGVSLTGGKTIASGGNTAIQSASVTMGDTARFDIGVDLTMDTSGNQELATLDVGGSLDVDSSAGAVDFKEHISVLGNTDLLVENAITLADDQKIESTGWIRSESDTFTMGDRSIIKSGESTSLFTDGDQELATLDIGDDFTATSQQGAIHFNESVTVANDMNLLAAREIILAAQQAINAGSMAIGSETLLGADRFSMGEDAVIHTRELTLVHTRGDQLIGQLVSDAADSAFYLKTTEGSINGRSDLDIASGERHLKATQRVGCDAEGENCTGGQGQLMAATGIGDPLVIDLPWLSAETDNGDINILASSDLHARLLKATNGNIYMTALGYLEIEELIGTPWLLVNDFLFADRMTLDRGGLASRESVVVNQITMTDGGPLGVYAPAIDLTIDGGDATETLMAMGGFNETLSLTSDARSYYQNLEAAAFKPESFANDVRVDINNTAQLHITDLLTQGGDLRMTGDLLIDAATVNTGQGYNMRMVTGYQTVDELSLNLNNSDGSALPVDGQFMTPYGEFWMSVDDVNVTTNAQFTRYNLPLLLTYKGSQDDLTTIGLPESFYRLSLEYQNEITNQTLEQITQGNPVAEQLSGDADPVSLSDSWVAANLPASEGNQAGSGNFDGDLEYEAEQSEEEEEYWLISEPGVEEES